MRYAFPASAGLLATLAAGLILFPFVYVIFDNFFELHFITPPTSSKSDLIIGVTLILWMLFSSFAGGFTCSLVAENKEDFHIFLLIIIAFIAGLLVSKGSIIEEWDSLLPVYGSFIIGYVLGGVSGVLYKGKVQREKIT